MSDDSWMDAGQGDFDGVPDRESLPARAQPEQDEESSDTDEADVEGGRLPYTYGRKESRANATSRSLMPAGEYQFLPVIGYMAATASTSIDGEEPYKIGGRTLTWWEEQSITPQYPYVLVNPVGYSNLDGEKHHYEEAFRFKKGEQFVLCDSGGYQMSTREEGEIVDSPEKHSLADVKLYPEKVVDWQVRNADAGLILDVPPNAVSEDVKLPNNKSFQQGGNYGYGTENIDDWIDNVFYDHLEMTVEHAGRMSDRLEELRDMGVPGAEDFIQLGVIHGRSIGRKHGGGEWELLEESHHAVEEAMGDVEAWALSPQPPHSLGQMALHMAYAMDRLEVDYVHVLQGGGNTQRALLDYFAMISDYFVTSDASSHIRGTQWRQFYVPGTWNQDIITITERHGERWQCPECGNETTFDQGGNEAPTCDECDAEVEMDFVSPYQQVDRFPCGCIVCRRAEREVGSEFITQDHDAFDGQTMNMHNLHQSMNSAKFISGVMRKYDENIVDSLEVKKDDLVVAEDHPESNNHSYNQFWHYMVSKFSRNNVVKLHKAMSFLRDVKHKGLEGAMDDGWHIPGSSTENKDELEYKPERDALDW